MNQEQLRAAAGERHAAAHAYARSAQLARLAASARPVRKQRRFAREFCFGPLCVRFVVWGGA